jgi:hypothetical protein
MKAWERALVTPIQWIHDLFFGSYIYGSFAPQYNNSLTYTVGFRVQYKHSVYEMWAESGVSGTLPTDSNYWILIQADFRGSNDRVKYNSQKLIFEALLNQWFDTTFRQPNFLSPHNSEIWIENTKIVDGSFLIRMDGNAVSFIRPDTYAVSYIHPDHVFGTSNFIIHYPISVIPDNSDEYNQLVSLANQYTIAGMVYKLQSY